MGICIVSAAPLRFLGLGCVSKRFCLALKLAKTCWNDSYWRTFNGFFSEGSSASFEAWWKPQNAFISKTHLLPSLVKVGRKMVGKGHNGRLFWDGAVLLGCESCQRGDHRGLRLSRSWRSCAPSLSSWQLASPFQFCGAGECPVVGLNSQRRNIWLRVECCGPCRSTRWLPAGMERSFSLHSLRAAISRTQAFLLTFAAFQLGSERQVF